MPLEQVSTFDVEKIADNARLFLLAVGVGTFSKAELAPLRFAGKDARDTANAFRELANSSFCSVETDVLVDEQATRDQILRAIEKLAHRVRPQDTSVLFLAGHGLCDELSDLYYFAPHDLDESSPLASAVHGTLFCEQFRQVPGRRLIILDTCNAGSLADWHGRSRGSTGPARGASFTLARQFGRQTLSTRGDDPAASEAPLVILASARANQEARESTMWENGAFTKSLIEGLSGHAENGTGVVTLRMLAGYLRRRVGQLTEQAQEPVCSVLMGPQDFEILRRGPVGASLGGAAEDPLIGQTIGAYRVVTKVVKTTRATIYRAVDDERPGAHIQLRVLDSELSSDPLLVRRFHEAAQVLSGASCDGLARVLEPGGRIAGDGRAFVVIESAPGRLLGEVMHSQPLLHSVALDVLRAAVILLRQLHQAGILYLSLNPNRIVLKDAGLGAFFLDGELACYQGQRPRLPWRRDEQALSDIADPELFLAPEVQADKEPPGPASDLYSVGALAYLLYFGRPPNLAATYGECRRSKGRAAPSLPARPPALSDAMAKLIERLLHPDAQQRPPLAEVEQFLQAGQQSPATPVPPAPPELSPPGPPSPPTPPAPETVKAKPDLHALPTVVRPAGLPGPRLSPSLLSRRWPGPEGRISLTPQAVIAAGTVLGLLSMTTLGFASWPHIRSWIQPGEVAKVLDGGNRNDGPGESPGQRPIPAPIPDGHAGTTAHTPICLPAGSIRGVDGSDRASGEIPILAFCIDRTEVRYGEFAAWLNTQSLRVRGQLVAASKDGREQAWADLTQAPGLRYSAGRFSAPPSMERQAVVGVSVYAAAAYCTARGGGLPSDTQWRYAAQGSRSGRRYPWGATPPHCMGVAVAELCAEAGRPTTVPAAGAAYQDQTPEGIRDLFGGVAEWLHPRRPAGGSAYHSHVGSAFATAVAAWSVPRSVAAGSMHSHVGFRCVQSPRPRPPVRVGSR